jgi:hypothetical protein
LSARVAARSLRCLQGGDEPIRQRCSGRLEERTLHLADHGFPGEHVPLDGIAVADTVAGPGEALGAGVCGGPAVGRHHPELA